MPDTLPDVLVEPIVDEKQKQINSLLAQVENVEKALDEKKAEVSEKAERIVYLEAKLSGYRKKLEHIRDNMVHGNENHVKSINEIL